MYEIEGFKIRSRHLIGWTTSDFQVSMTVEFDQIRSNSVGVTFFFGQPNLSRTAVSESLDARNRLRII